VSALAARQAARRKRLLESVARHSVLIGLGIVFVSPFAFVIFTALMTRDQALTRAIWPHPFRFSNFSDVLFHGPPLLRWTWNTFLVSFLSSVGVVLSCAPPAYALARMRFKGRNLVFLLVLSTMMLPIQVTIIPLYVLFSHLGWIGSLKPLIIPGFFGDAFSIFLLRQFFMTIPGALTDAARVDGAGELRLLLRVIVPLAKPALVAVFLFNFLYCWNDLFAPLLYVGADPASYTVSLGLSEFRSSRHVDYELMMAACVLFTLPVTILFFLAQRAFVEGVTLTGVKG
jgi:multiple sugar transport system permease protein